MESPAVRPRFADHSRRAFPLVVLAVGLIAAVGGIQAVPPPDVPTYALDSGVVYRCEVTLALFVALYLLVVAVFLSVEGKTVGKVTTTGFELPSELSGSVTMLQALIERQDRAERKFIERDRSTSQDIERIWEALDAIELEVGYGSEGRDG